MKKGRMVVNDLNAARGVLLVPLLDTADWGSWYAGAGYYDALVETEQIELTLMTPIVVASAIGHTGPTPTVYDVAVLAFRSVPGKGLRVPLYGPGPIFMADGLTVNAADVDVAAFVAFMLVYGSDSQGNGLTAYAYGSRIAG